MKRGLFILFCVIAALYWALHLALGSSPVQQRVVDEIRKALASYGLELEIESIEFSALTPKIYLNKVTISSKTDAKLRIDVPLTIDKLKIRFSPLALISKRLVIDEMVLYNPKVILPRGDQMYRRVERFLKKREPIEVEGGSFKVVVRKVGVVDALFNVLSKNPAFGIRSRSLTAFFFNRSQDQQNFSLQSRDLEIDRGELSLVLNNIDLDVDLAPESLRVNKALLESQNLFVDVKGMTSLPLNRKGGPARVTASYEMSLPLEILNKIPELDVPEFAGILVSSGNVELEKGSYSGSGKLNYGNVLVDGYGVGNGEFTFALSDRRVNLKSVNLRYGGGEVLSKSLAVNFEEDLTLEGDVNLRGVQLEKILTAVKLDDPPIRLGINGKLGVSGRLSPEFKIEAEMKNLQLNNFVVLNENLPSSELAHKVIEVQRTVSNGKLIFSLDRMEFSSVMEIFDGKAQADGYVGFNTKLGTKLRARGENVDLAKLKRIAEVTIGGRANLVADIDASYVSGTKISGSLDIAGAEIADLVLGNTKGLAHYQNELLSFEDISVRTNLEPVKGSGFIDFKNDTHYKFRAEGRRVQTDELFEIFRKKEITFTIPKGGEVSARVTIEGGHDDKGVEVNASGKARNFNWYDERWVSSSYSLIYRTDKIDLEKVVLLKKSGALDLSGVFEKDNARLDLTSRGLRAEELNVLGKAPLAGEIVGGIRLEGQFPNPVGSGSLTLTNSSFRDVALEDSTFKLSTKNEQIEVLASLRGEKLKGRWARSRSGSGGWELLLYFSEYDFAPLLAVAMGRDIPTFSDVTATGDISLTGTMGNWKSLKGSGTVSKLNLGLKGTPMTNRQPLEIRIDEGTVKVNRFNLVGRDGQLLVGLIYQPGEKIRASLDGKIDLQFIQPFIPGLEYGTGKVSMGLRVSGKPPNFDLLGNVVLEDGTFRLLGLNDELRNAQVQLGLNQNRVNIDRFEAVMNGGRMNIQGDVKIGKDRNLIPDLKLTANRVGMNIYDSLMTRFSGDFVIQGTKQPYLLKGQCRLQEGKLSSFEVKPSLPTEAEPLFEFDITAQADRNLLVKTPTMDAEFKGNLQVVGDSNEVGMLGSAELLKGSLFFRETEFDMNSGLVRFESKSKISPRFDVSGQAVVKEQKTQVPQEYVVTIKALGTPADYKILLSSSPALAEADIISLLVLGVTSRTREGNEGNYVDLGTALVGEVPIQSKLEDQLGVEIRFAPQSSTATLDAGAATGDVTVPMVEIQTQIGTNTTLSASSSIGATTPTREIKIEHALGERVTINGSVVNKPQGNVSTPGATVQSYGLDFRYRFQFE